MIANTLFLIALVYCVVTYGLTYVCTILADRRLPGPVDPWAFQPEVVILAFALVARHLGL